MLSSESCDIFKSNFLAEHLWTTASVKSFLWNFFILLIFLLCRCRNYIYWNSSLKISQKAFVYNKNCLRAKHFKMSTRSKIKEKCRTCIWRHKSRKWISSVFFDWFMRCKYFRLTPKDRHKQLFIKCCLEKLVKKIHKTHKKILR